MSAIPVLILSPLLFFAFASALIGIWRSSFAYRGAVAGVAISLGAAIYGLQQVLARGELRHYMGGWPPPFGIEVGLDPLSAFMALLIVFVGLITVIYPPEVGLYQTPGRGFPVHGLILLLLGGLVGVVITRDLFNLFVFLEIYSLASYALVSLGGSRAVVASFRYLMLGSLAGGLYLLGVGFIYFSVGTLNMADAAGLLPAVYDSPAVIGAVALIIVGMGVKLALFPLHVWLPDAHSYAPPTIAALLAALQIKVGAYVIVRMMISVFEPRYLIEILPVTTLLSWVGAAGIIFGSVMAIAQQDFKRMLAYSTVAQVGFIGLGIGLANPLGLVGGLLHMLNHAFMKSCLFLVAGGIRHQTGLHEIPQFAGLGRRMPWTMAGFSVAALSMVGIPPAAGFFSKWYLVLGSLDAGNWVFVAVILFSSLLTAVYFFRMLEIVYTGVPTDEAGAGEAADSAAEPSAQILVPILILAGGVLVLGLGNTVILHWILEPVAAFLRYE